jgi:hypothetical protein
MVWLVVMVEGFIRPNGLRSGLAAKAAVQEADAFEAELLADAAEVAELFSELAALVAELPAEVALAVRVDLLTLTSANNEVVDAVKTPTASCSVSRVAIYKSPLGGENEGG